MSSSEDDISEEVVDEDEDPRRAIANELIREIVLHAEAEEMVIHPYIEFLKKQDAFRDMNGENGYGESSWTVSIPYPYIGTHGEMKKELWKLDTTRVYDPQFREKLDRVMK
ncbi:hypothetical protein HK102_013837, partial [Quaeritorhiza haematococci]